MLNSNTEKWVAKRGAAEFIFSRCLDIHETLFQKFDIASQTDR